MALIDKNRRVRVLPTSWENLAAREQVKAKEGDVSYFGMVDWPKIEPSDGDLEVYVEDGDRLDRLAHRYYGDQDLWWVIAVRNEMVFPLIETVPGTKVVIPDPSIVKARFVRS